MENIIKTVLAIYYAFLEKIEVCRTHPSTFHLQKKFCFGSRNPKRGSSHDSLLEGFE